MGRWTLLKQALGMRENPVRNALAPMTVCRPVRITPGGELRRWLVQLEPLLFRPIAQDDDPSV